MNALSSRSSLLTVRVRVVVEPSSPSVLRLSISVRASSADLNVLAPVAAAERVVVCPAFLGEGGDARTAEGLVGGGGRVGRVGGAGSRAREVSLTRGRGKE